jgi:hypothetical protein
VRLDLAPISDASAWLSQDDAFYDDWGTAVSATSGHTAGDTAQGRSRSLSGLKGLAAVARFEERPLRERERLAARNAVRRLAEAERKNSARLSALAVTTKKDSGTGLTVSVQQAEEPVEQSLRNQIRRLQLNAEVEPPAFNDAMKPF